jgi:xylitol oxidase
MDELQNWAGNYKYSTNSLHEPESVEHVQKLVTQHSKIKVLGTRHSFNGIADSTENLISLKHLNQVLSLDTERQTVIVEAGIKYGDLCKYLHQSGYAMHNMASLPHISVAGACATATHGSGDRNGNLATAVRTMEIVTASGEIVIISSEQQDKHIDGMVVGLGGLGVVTQLTLDVVPEFQMRQDVYENLPLIQLRDHFDDIFSSAYSVSLFTDWRNSTFNQLWVKSRVTEHNSFELKTEFYGATLATTDLHPVIGCATENCTEQMGKSGPSHERLPHFRMDFTPSNGAELQSEYIVPRSSAYEALCAIDQLSEHVAPLLLISEIRTIAEDNLWMSPSYQQKSVAIHFTWKDDWKAVQKVLPMIEEQLAQFHARPHWGKLFTMQPSRVKSLYEKLPDFQELLQHYDPHGKFRNSFLDTYIWSGE